MKAKELMENVLVLSTAHLSEDDVTVFESPSGQKDVIPFEYGYMMPVSNYMHDEWRDFPNVRRCLELADSLGCSYIIWDRDAEYCDYLPRYEW